MRPLAKAKVPLGDKGLQGAQGVFETMRTRRGQIWQLEAHLARLHEGAEFVGIEINPSRLRKALDAICKSIPACAGDGKLRLLATGTGAGFADRSTARMTATFSIAPKPRRTEAGLTVGTLPFYQDARDPRHQHKLMGYSAQIAMQRQALGAGWDAGLAQATKGGWVESSTANLLAKVDGAWFAPGPKSGALPGTTRQWALSHVDAQDAPIPEVPQDIEELWLLSSIAGPRLVTSIDGQELPGAEQWLRREWVEALDAWR